MRLLLAAFALFLGASAPAFCGSVDQASAHFLGASYVLGPLGEARYDVFDQNPLQNLQDFDCTTYVETVIAAAGAMPDVSPSAFLDRLTKIRYKSGVISYATRNHFPELDWLPSNEAAGWITDVTAQIGGAETAWMDATIDKGAWYRARTAADIRPPRSDAETQALVARLHALGDGLLPQSVKIAYLPTQTLIGVDGTAPNEDLLAQLPSAGVINIVRENWQPAGVGTAMIISHQMILIRVNGELRLRHASPDHGVIEVGFVDYLKTLLGSPTIRGVNVLRIN